VKSDAVIQKGKMNKLDLFKYTGNLFKKSLENYISKLKKKVSKHLENNDLEKTKEIIKEIEGIRNFQKETDFILQNYSEQFPEDKPPVENFQPANKTDKNYTYYTSEIMEIFKSVEQLEIFELKASLYNEIVTHISLKEISNNEKIPGLLNWEINFYKSVALLLSKEFIRFDDYNCLIITDKGEKYYGDDVEIDEFINNSDEDENNVDVEDEVFNELVEKDKDMDLITSIRSYLISNLIEDGILTNNEESHYYKVMFYIIKNLYTVEGLLVESWDQIKENNFYKINSYFSDNEPVVFIQEKYAGYNVLKCVDEENSTTYFAFI